jgi:putative two-component system response regulator
MDIWPTPPSHWDLLGRIQTLLRLKKYIDEQAKAAVFSAALSVDSKQNMRNGHSDHLVAYVEQLGESFGLGEGDLKELRLASWLHDIGKISVPESILFKSGPLNAEETRIIREHPVIGERMCAPIKSLRGILPVIRHHHEKMDGSGYPDGLSGEAIPLKARILQIADIYDALTTHRPYRGALPPEEALQILFGEAEKGWLDASMVLKFSQVCRENDSSFGSSVDTSEGVLLGVLVLWTGLTVRQRGPFSDGEIWLGLSPRTGVRCFERDRSG